jgi:hypothetical protein
MRVGVRVRVKGPERRALKTTKPLYHGKKRGTFKRTLGILEEKNGRYISLCRTYNPNPNLNPNPSPSLIPNPKPDKCRFTMSKNDFSAPIIHIMNRCRVEGLGLGLGLTVRVQGLRFRVRLRVIRKKRNFPKIYRTSRHILTQILTPNP